MMSKTSKKKGEPQVPYLHFHIYVNSFNSKHDCQPSQARKMFIAKHPSATASVKPRSGDRVL